MGWHGHWRLIVAVTTVLLCAACADSPATDASSGTDSPTPVAIQGGLSLVRSGTVLHAGNYCHYLQAASSYAKTLPVDSGCQFYITAPSDLFATDGGHYSVSEVVGDAMIGVQGPPDSMAMIICRLSPRAQFWFWISADGHWNIDRVDDIHNPQALVSVQDEEALRQYVKPGALNYVQFKCAGGRTSNQISLALNVNNNQFAALTVPMPSPGTPLANPTAPWFVDLGARVTTEGTLQATVGRLMLYDRE